MEEQSALSHSNALATLQTVVADIQASLDEMRGQAAVPDSRITELCEKVSKIGDVADDLRNMRAELDAALERISVIEKKAADRADELADEIHTLTCALTSFPHNINDAARHSSLYKVESCRKNWYRGELVASCIHEPLYDKYDPEKTVVHVWEKVYDIRWRYAYQRGFVTQEMSEKVLSEI